MRIQDAPHGLNVVVETQENRIYIGRFDSVGPFAAILHDCDLRDFAPGEDREGFVRETATYGIDVKERDVELAVAAVKSVRLLRDVPKLDAV